jgi:hypothetical protein
MGMNRLNSHFLHPYHTSPELSGDDQGAVVFKLGVSPGQSRLLNGSHHFHLDIAWQALGCSAEMAVSHRHNYQSTNGQWQQKMSSWLVASK